MKSLMLFVFLAVITTGYGLKCYDCTAEGEDCEKDKLNDDKSKTCPDGMNRCMRIWGKKDDKTTIASSCSNEDMCKKMEEECEDPKEGECKVGCCEEDNCNASSTVSFSVILMAACSVVGLALLK